MKTLDNAEYHATRNTASIPSRRPSAPTGKLKLCATVKIKDNVAFFHLDDNGAVWQSYAGRNFRQQHIFYAQTLLTFMATVFNAGWYSLGACKWAKGYQSDWLVYVATRAKVTSSGFTNF